MAEVERLAGRVLMMKAGRIVDDAVPKALLARYGRANLEEVFLDIARGASAPGHETDAPDAGLAEARAAEGSGA